MTKQELCFTEREITKIVKILEMTRSEIDAEALAAVRMSQHILKKHNSNYEILFNTIRNDTQNFEAEVKNLRNVVQDQSNELEILRKKASQVQSQLSKSDIFHSSNVVKGSIYHLKNFLLNRLSLQIYERKLLENISKITPKSKEEYLVLICARRHKISFQLD
ncbi:MAG: hypothetical protein V7750_14540 [Sneathiella sp.]